MIEPKDQGPEATLEALAPVMPVVYRAAEAAVQQSREFFGDDEKIDRPLFPNLVRYYIKCALNDRGLRAVDEETVDLEHTILPNNGLLLEYGPRRIRIRKADHGALPAPVSLTLQRYYEQLSLLEEPLAFQNLVLLWDLVDGLLQLELVCPKHGGEQGASAHWTIPVPHPAHDHEAPDAVDEPFEFDVPIRLPDAASDDE